MKAVLHHRFGSPEGVAYHEDVPVPPIGDDQVLVRVRASSVNPAEWYAIMGPVFARFGNGIRRPKKAAIGIDLAGTVEKVGAQVTELAPGDEVFGTSGVSWAEYAPARPIKLARKPASVSFEAAAAVPVAALTALQALRKHGHVEAGQRVLVNGASGGVGTYAVQLAKVLGAEVTAVCSTRNVEQAHALGADRVVDYTREDFTTLGVRHDVLLDVTGTRSYGRLRRVVKPEGRIVAVGAKMKGSGLGPLPHIGRLLLASRGRKPKVTFFVSKIDQEDLEYLARQLETGAMRSVVDRTYDLADVVGALRYLGEGHARGKVVLTV